MFKVILLSGRQGSGKTTLQKDLVAHFQYHLADAIMVNFADALYEMHDAVLKVLHKYRPPRDIVKDGPLLQVLGTQWGRETIDQNIWVDILRTRVNVAQYKADLKRDLYVVVGDCRFENEFNAFPEALRVRLYCPEAIRQARCSMWRPNTRHASETALDDFYLKDKFDLVLNTQTLSREAAVDRVVDALQTDWYRRRKNAKT